MTPKEIITKHISKIRGIRVPDVQRSLSAAFKEIEEYDYIIVCRSELLRDPQGFAVRLKGK